MKEHNYDSINWGEFFYCDPTSKSGLRWAVDKYSAYGKKKETWSGKEAGTLSDVKNKENKAWSIALNLDGKYKHYKVHRIIAVMHGISVNGKVIDHLNGVSSDNRIENIRVTSQLVNTRNRQVSSNSPYGMNGVGYQEDSNGNSYFIARGVTNGERQQKSFPIKRLGIMEAFKQAVIARQRYVDLINKSGAIYTDRHTKVSDNLEEYIEYKLSKEEYTKSFRNTKMSKANTTGTKGVGFTEKSLGNTYVVASWNENGKQRNKSFSVNKHGILPAFAMAVKYRTEVLEELYKE